MRYLIVDGMLSGTGVRDAVEGGYLDLHDLGISSELVTGISLWLARYEKAHYAQFEDLEEVFALDSQGIELSKRLKTELPDSKIEYFSSGKMQKIRFD
jgi:hypothetical protein